MSANFRMYNRGLSKRAVITSLAFILILFTVIGLMMWNNHGSYIVKGESMTPTFYNGERIDINQSQNTPANDEIVVFTQQEQWPQYDADRHGQLVIKRIVATPGDQVELKDSDLLVNGSKVYSLPKDYTCKVDGFSETVPNHRLFVLGDNTDDSRDSLRALCLESDDPYVHGDDIKDWGTATERKPLFNLGGITI